MRGLAAFVRRQQIGRGHRLVTAPGPHVADEAQPLAGNGADQFLALATVADRLARGIDAAGQGRLRHDPAAPDRRDEIVLRDDAIAVLNEANQQIEHLRLDGNGFGAAVQLTPVGVEHVIGKEKLHAAAPRRFAKPLFAQKRPCRGKAGLLHFSRLPVSSAHGPVADLGSRRHAQKVQNISRKKQCRPQCGFKPVMRSAAKHAVRATARRSNSLHLRCGKSLKGQRPWRSRLASPPAPACCQCSATTSKMPSRSAVTQPA